MAAAVGCLRRLTCSQVLKFAPAGTVHVKRFLRVDPEEEIERLFLSRSFKERQSEIIGSKGEPAGISSSTRSDATTLIQTNQPVSATTILQRKPRKGGAIGCSDGENENVSKLDLQSSPVDCSDDRGDSKAEKTFDLRKKDVGDNEDDGIRTSNDNNDAISTSAAKLVPIAREVLSQDIYMHENNASQGLSVLYHYNIFHDLFNCGNIIFLPDSDICFKVAYDCGTGDHVLPVFMGNKLPAVASSDSPYISFNGMSGKHYSLLFLSLDGHLSESQAEYLHWSCVNMTSDKGIESGQSTEYLQALPLRGTGYHRYVFLLMEHDVPIDVSALMPNVSSFELNSRTFHFNEFFSAVSEQCGAVPVGIKFFQSEWDNSVKHVFHHVLDMPEPSYAYDYPERPRPRQVKFPHREPFHIYLDQYRDKKEVAEEVIKEHLSEISPFKPLGTQTLPYPLARPTKPGLYADNLPATWIQDNHKHKVNKTYKYTYVYKND